MKVTSTGQCWRSNSINLQWIPQSFVLVFCVDFINHLVERRLDGILEKPVVMLHHIAWNIFLVVLFIEADFPADLNHFNVHRGDT